MPDLSKVPTEDLLAMREKASKPSLAEVPTEQLLKMRDEAVATMRPKTAIGESALRGAAQGATLGFADEITAGAGALKDYAAGKLGLRGDIGLKDAYGTYITKIRAKDEAAQADNPKTFVAGNVAGGIAASLVPGAVLGKSAQAADKGGRLVRTLKGAAKAGAVGGTVGAGTSEANPFESPDKLKEFGKDVGFGAAVGGAAQGGFSLLGKGFNALKPTELRKLANQKTVKAAGFMGADLKKMSQQEIQDLGETLHRTGVVKALDGLADIMEKAKAGKEEAGQAIGKALEGVDSLVTKSKSLIDAGQIGGSLPQAGKDALKASVDKQFQFNMGRIGQRIQKELIEPNAQNPLLKGEISKLSTIADDFMSSGTTSLKAGNVIKGTQGRVTNFNSDTVPQAFKKEIYDIIKTELDEIVGKTGNLEAAVARGEGNALAGNTSIAGRNKSVFENYQGAKRDYGALKKTAEIAEGRLGSTQGQREISLTDYLAGGAALATGGPSAAVVAGGANKLMRKYGDSVMAAGARTAAEIIESAPKKLGRFAQILESAARKGAPALNTTHISLMKDPDYQRILENFERSGAIRRRLQGGPK